MADMTYGNYNPGGSDFTGPPGPQYPYGPPRPVPLPAASAVWRVRPVRAAAGAGWLSPPYPPSPTNPLATLSIVFAFLFAPAGAVLGHLALGQIARTGQRGRDRALIGLTLSYVLIAVAVVGLTLSLVMSAGPRTGRRSPPRHRIGWSRPPTRQRRHPGDRGRR